MIKAPFPAFGGKAQIVNVVWERLGEPRNYVEPFAFSAVMMLRRPTRGQIETINDVNCYVANFWRAIKAAPDEVAEHADWPVNETDLHARHRWLVASELANSELVRVREDPEYFNAKIAGWWCWGACCWIGSGWCDQTHRNSAAIQRPDLDNGQLLTVAQMPDLSGDGSSGRGVHSPTGNRVPLIGDNTAFGRGVVTGALLRDRHAKRPGLGDGHGSGGAKGVLSEPTKKKPNTCGSGHSAGVCGAGDGAKALLARRPQLCNGNSSAGQGVNRAVESGTCEARRQWVREWFAVLSDRLRTVRVCCGDWSRICDSPSTMDRLGITAVFLDPPYRKKLADGSRNRTSHIYSSDRGQDVGKLCDRVENWSLEWGNHRDVRIALCGLEGEYPKLDAAEGWQKFYWRSRGGYGNRTARGKANAGRETIWFSPHCLKPRHKNLFEEALS